MSICAPKPFGSKFLKGGYSYWPLWWYGQRNKLHDMSGHGVDLTPSGAYFDGQGYYFDGVDDYLADAGGQKFLYDQTEGSWHSIYLTEGDVPAKGSVQGTGTYLRLATYHTPVITGKIVLRREYCPNLTKLDCYLNQITVLDVSTITSLVRIACAANCLTALDVENLIKLEFLSCHTNNISALNLNRLTALKWVYCRYNSMDESAVDAVLCALASHSVENGNLQIHGNAPPSSDGEDCKYILVHDLGWSVTTD